MKIEIKKYTAPLYQQYRQWSADLRTNRRKQALTAVVTVLFLVFLNLLWHHRPVVAKDTPVVPGQVESGHEIRFAPDAPQLAYLKIVVAEAQPVPLVEPFAGRVAYDENHTGRLFAPVAGRVLRTLVQAGDTVRAGQPVVLLDAPDYADLAKAGSQLKTAQLAYERSKALFDAQVIARKELEQSRNELNLAQAEQQRAAARLRYLKPQADGVALLAPQAGIVTERHAMPGMEVTPATDAPLLVVSDPRQVWVMAELPEQELGKLKAGQPVSVTVDAYPELNFEGVVEAVGDVLDPLTRRVIVRCAVPNAARRLKPEMFARVTPVTSDEHLPKVTNAALVTEGLKTYLFVEKSPGLLEKREVELAFRGHQHSYVKTGLDSGERVVSAGALLLNAELSGH